jgi:hypothetical protein
MQGETGRQEDGKKELLGLPSGKQPTLAMS